MGFIEGHGAVFGPENVVIIHDRGKATEERTETRGIIQGESGQFNIDTPIYEGDFVEADDPRGGKRLLYAEAVKLNGSGRAAGLANLAHTSVKWGTPPSNRSHSNAQAPVVIVHGNNTQVAFNNGSVSQSQVTKDVPAGFDDLAKAVGEILRRLDELPEADRETASSAANELLVEVVRDEPDESTIHRLSAQLKGVLAPVAMGLAKGVGSGLGVWAKGLISQLG